MLPINTTVMPINIVQFKHTLPLKQTESRQPMKIQRSAIWRTNDIIARAIIIGDNGNSINRIFQILFLLLRSLSLFLLSISFFLIYLYYALVLIPTFTTISVRLSLDIIIKFLCFLLIPFVRLIHMIAIHPIYIYIFNQSPSYENDSSK